METLLYKKYLRYKSGGLIIEFMSGKTQTFRGRVERWMRVVVVVVVGGVGGLVGGSLAQDRAARMATADQSGDWAVAIVHTKDCRYQEEW